jgi:hypothetical protein
MHTPCAGFSKTGTRYRVPGARYRAPDSVSGLRFSALGLDEGYRKVAFSSPLVPPWPEAGYRAPGTENAHMRYAGTGYLAPLSREAHGMSWLRRTLHIGVGLGALAVRRAQEVAQRLEAEGRQVLERPDNPVEKARARLGRWTESVRKTFQELAVHLYYTVGVTPLQETQRLHQRVDELETRLTRKTRGDAARSDS